MSAALAGGGQEMGRGEGRRGGQFSFTGWQPTGQQAHLSGAAGLSAGPVNLPDRSLQVPLIPLIQFIWLTARMRPLSTGEIKPLAAFLAALVCVVLVMESQTHSPRHGDERCNVTSAAVRLFLQMCLCSVILCTQG